MKHLQIFLTLLILSGGLVPIELGAQSPATYSRLSLMQEADFVDWLVGTEWQYEDGDQTCIHWFVAPDVGFHTSGKGREFHGYPHKIVTKGQVEWDRNPEANTAKGRESYTFKINETLNEATFVSGSKNMPAKLIARRLPPQPANMILTQFDEWLRAHLMTGNDGSVLKYLGDSRCNYKPVGRTESNNERLRIIRPGLIRLGNSDVGVTFLFSPDLQTYSKINSRGSTRGSVSGPSQPIPPQVPGPVATIPAPVKSAPVSMEDAAPVALKETSAALNSLLVADLGNSRFAGMASKLSISALKLQSDTAATITFNQDVGPAMETALRTVVRFEALRHSGWPRGYRIELAYADKYSPKDGPSAATACALALDSLITGIKLDPAFAITGDLNADGTVQPVGGVIAKLRGASKSGMRVVAIPEKNRSSTTDLAISEGLPPFLGVQMLSVANFEEALALARVERSAELQASLAQFSAICRDLQANPETLRSQVTVSSLSEVARRTPNHISARILLAMARNSLPLRLSAGGSMEAVDQSVAAVLEATGSDLNASSRLDAGQVGAARTRLQRLRNQVDQRIQPYVDAWIEWTKLADQIIARRSASPAALAQFQQASKKIDAEMLKLVGNTDLKEELMR